MDRATDSSLPGTGLALSVRMGNSPTPDATWSDFLPLASSGAAIGGASRYIQYQAVLTERTRVGRRNQYTINPTVEMRHQLQRGFEIGALLELLQRYPPSEPPGVPRR